ncbi:hypothetical protein O181_020177 [Austropuccinia psidii MF-1]|uniref:Reverse transcriptase Ty1/copia-type domain-containing protein n=1 Tax=Austropuccinia psidii MF-1 TaxID=1389203 RepID=A0A9Q3GV35_9BASI|nr:hypothetical protein [Austropuccinia psidii MF-1]
MTDLSEASKEVPCESIQSIQWVFVKKPERFKARLVALGFYKIHGINYEERFAPKMAFSEMQFLFSIASTNNWKIQTFDVKVAFLHNIINKTVYLWVPQGMNIPKFQVLKLHKALYGTEQENKCWCIYLKDILQKIGFAANGEDPSTSTLQKDGEHSILLINIDDGALMNSSTKTLPWINNILNAHLKIKWDTNIKVLVGIAIEETTEG